MRIRQIIYESVSIQFKNVKAFVLVFLLTLTCEVISTLFHKIPVNHIYPLLMIFRIIITIILIGISLNIVEHCIFQHNIHLHFMQHFMEGIKEYTITMYYLVIPTILSIFFMLPTGLYTKILHITEYIQRLDIDATALTIEQIAHQLPHTIHISLQHSIQLNMLIAIFLFVLFTSFSFISKILLLKYDNMKIAMDFRNITKIVHNIGYARFMKFIVIFTVILIFLVNILISLEIYLSDVVLSALFESFLLFFGTNAFYELYLEQDTKVIIQTNKSNEDSL